MEYWVYGTVFNNADTVEDAIKSVFKPEYNIVVVDAYSTDGTYEKLLEIRKDYNLKVLRCRGNRGRGRDCALRSCPDGSRTGYVSFDIEYNENFHKLMLSDVEGLLASSDEITFFGNRDIAVKAGGWPNLSYGEDTVFALRTGIKVTVPAIIGYDLELKKIERKGQDREKRYANGLRYYIRKLDLRIDGIRSFGLRFSDINATEPPWKLLNNPLYLAASLRGIHRYDDSLNNFDLLNEVAMSTIADPKQFGIADCDVIFQLWSPLNRTIPDEKLKEVWGKGYKYSSTKIIRPKLWGPGRINLYMKTTHAMEHLGKMRLSHRCNTFQLVEQFG